LNDLVDCFKIVDSLFYSKTEIILNEHNLSAFEYISNFLDKRMLSKLCKEVYPNISPVFKLTSKHFKYIYQNDFNKLNDFKLIVNGKVFQINFSLFCCLSDKFLEMNQQEQELRCSIPNNYLPCFIAFLDIFKGLPFYFENYSLESISFLIQLFGLSSLSKFICENIPHPQNIQQITSFLSKISCEFNQMFLRKV
jgi:hypothetical protein